MKPVYHLPVIVSLVGLCVSPHAGLAQLAPETNPTPPATFSPLAGTPALSPLAPTKPQPAATTASIAGGILAFDAETKKVIIKLGEKEAKFTFNLANISSGAVTVSRVQTSCGCTTAQLPPMPWTVAAGATGQIVVVMNVQGKSGVIPKMVTVYTDKGQKTLMVETTIPVPEPQLMSPADRERNQLLAKADRQAVFKGDCAKCHVEPAIGKYGKNLYLAACGICHEAEHRATMVPDLHNLPNDTNGDYWKLMTTLGKADTLMPAFAQAHGGPLSDPQIDTLVGYLAMNFPAQVTNTRPVLPQPKP